MKMELVTIDEMTGCAASYTYVMTLGRVPRFVGQVTYSRLNKNDPFFRLRIDQLDSKSVRKYKIGF